MNNHSIEFREERDLGQKLNVTFGFIRQHYKVLLMSTLYFVVPFALLAGVASGLYQYEQLGFLRDMQNGGVAGFYGSVFTSPYYWLQIFFMLVSVAMLSLAVYSYIVYYMDYGQKPEVSDVWAGVKSNFIPVLYSLVGLAVIWIIATLFLVLPGIYVGVACSMLVMVMVREEVGFIDALERCFYLVKGNWWATFGFLIVLSIIQGVIGFVASVPTIVIYVLSILGIAGNENSMLLVFATVFSTIISLVLYIILFTGIAFQYFSLVEIKEGTGLLEQVENIGRKETNDHAYEE